jgi:hypothetical protein
MYLLVREGARMSLGYFAMLLHPPGSDSARTMQQDIDRLGFLDARRFEEAWIGEHFTARWETILNLWQT